MKPSLDSSPSQSRQTREQFANPDVYLDYELGKAVQELPPLYTRLVGVTLSLAVFGAIAWAAFSEIDDVAVARGQIILGQKVQPLRSPSAGKIKNINATKLKQSQRVQQGEFLIELDSESSQVDIQGLNNKRQLLNKEYQHIEELGKGQKARINQEKLELDRLINSFAGAEEEKDRLCPLRISYLKCNDAKRKVKDLKLSIQQQAQKIKQIEADYEVEITSKKNQLDIQLAENKREIGQAQNQRLNQIIKAPISGTVHKVKVNSSQGTVQQGEELLSILPEGEEPLLEVYLPNQYRGLVEKQMKAKVKIDTFPYQEFGVIEGTVVDVSPDVDSDAGKNSGKEVYPTRIRLHKLTIRARGEDKPLTAGMVASADIVIGRKSILRNLIEPVMRKFDGVFSRK